MSSDPKQNLLDYAPAQLCNLVEKLGAQPFVGQQLAQWVYHHKKSSFSDMTNLSKSLRARLEEAFEIKYPELQTEVVSKDGTQKYLLSFEDGQTAETVWIPKIKTESSQKLRHTVCISSQVGCNMGCHFCHTGTQKKQRNLTHAEIIGQILFLYSKGLTVTNVVFMGMGEPLEKSQLDTTLKVCQTLSEPYGLGIGHRKITVSTCGLVPGLKRMMKESKVNIAVSLHAPTQEIRAQIMPISKTHSMDELLELCRKEFPETRKRITFEYVLLKDINDSKQHAQTLVSKLHGVRAKINLLNFNPFPGSTFERSSDEAAQLFSDTCIQKGIQTNIRSSRGMDVMAACGQLRSENNG
jgi:23S rRNA (adenine2503-C2)-methyltransferase